MANSQVNKFYLHNTLREMIHFAADKYPNDPAYLYTERKKDVTVTFSGFLEDIDAFGTWLYEKGYKDCNIAMFGENSYHWILTHFAVTCGKNVIVPLDKELSPAELAELIQEGCCRAVFYSGQYADIGAKLKEMNLPGVEIYSMKDIPAFIEEGKKLLKEGYNEYREVEIEKDDMASIVFTSGTSGKSKGVMLTHYNFCSNAYASCDAIDLKEGTSLLLLPLHHTFGLVTNVFSAISFGYPVYINRSLKRLVTDIQKVKPYILVVVPLMVEAIHRKIWDTAKKEGKDKALRTLMKFSDFLLKIGIDVRRKLFGSVLSSFGGNLELIISGGAPIDEKYIKDFRSMGVTIQNGYGITECSPVVCVTRGKFAALGSAGTPLCCNQIRISSEGEIQVHGDNVMVGYYNNEKENAGAFTEDGWLKTGDLGRIDEKGELYITGRIKNLIILANGENISAEAVEEKIYAFPYVKEAIAYGENGVIIAEVYLDEEVPDGKDRIQEDIKKLNRDLPLVKNIGKIIVRDTEFPKTSTKKIKRNRGE